MASDHTATTRIGLPEPPRAQGHYQPGVLGERFVLTAGMTPRIEGVLQYVGQVGEQVSVADAQRGASIAAANALSAAAETAGSVEAITQVLRMTVYVNAGSGFTEHTMVADGASQQLVDLIGDRGAGVRSAVGASSLPGGACVEVELTCLRED